MRSFILVLSAAGAHAAMLRAAQEPDTACGKGFDNLVGGSQEYYKTAAKELWNHPYHLTDAATFWKKFSANEVKWFKDSYPALPIEGDVKTVSVSANEARGEGDISYKQAMNTVKEINKKELLCLTLFTIDDECVKYPHIRLGK